MRVMIQGDPYEDRGYEPGPLWGEVFTWPCRWVSIPEAHERPLAVAYRCRFELDSAETVRVHVTADERYELFADGRRVGRGPERGDLQNWFYETYDLEFGAGEHVVVARVWSFGPLSPTAQVSLRHGFLLSPHEDAHVEMLGTGVADWQGKALDGYHFFRPERCHMTGPRVEVDGARFTWGFKNGQGEGWGPVEPAGPAVNGLRTRTAAGKRLLKPGMLPAMLEERLQVGRVVFVSEPEAHEEEPAKARAEDDLEDEHAQWTDMLQGRGSVTVPPGTRRRVIVDLGDYYCAYPEVSVSGGAGGEVRVLWAESLCADPDALEGSKGNRDEVTGKYFVGFGDTFRPDGGEGRLFETLWWRPGRYLEVRCTAADKPLRLDGLAVRETHYPMENEGELECSDERWDPIVPIMVRGLQMCSHETYMDCPYYEQLMYVGDTRLEVLTTCAITRDDRLSRKAVRMFDASRIPEGLTACAYPSGGKTLIAPFSLWWAAMVWDYAHWRDDDEFVRSMVAAARAVMDYFLGCRNADSLVEAPRGWNFMDWVNDEGWEFGAPPDGQWGVSGMINWQFTLLLDQMVDLEEMVGEPELAARYRRLAAEQAQACEDAFWNEDRGLFADTLDHRCFSEHAQCLALLSNQLSDARGDRVADGLVSDPDLSRSTIYFSFYLLEALGRAGKMDAFFERLEEWYRLPELGFKTTYEVAPDGTRSDCHAWGAHPLWHYYATILGIRPAAPGFTQTRIEPKLGPLDHASGKLPHPRGFIEVGLEAADGQLTGAIVLPDGVTGEFVDGERTVPLKPGRQGV